MRPLPRSADCGPGSRGAGPQSVRTHGVASRQTLDLWELRLRIEQAAAAAESAWDAHAAAGSARAVELAGVAELLDQLAALLAGRPSR